MNKEDVIRYLRKQTWYFDGPADYDLLIVARAYRRSGPKRVYAKDCERWVLKGTFNDLVEAFIHKCETCLKTPIEKYDSGENLQDMKPGIRLTVCFNEAFVEDGKLME